MIYAPRDTSGDSAPANQHVTPERWDAALRDASLGVRHIWWEPRCPAYRTLDAADCTCVVGAS